jgi:hypothetical protein
MKKTILLASGFLFVLASVCLADIPKLINYQGMLTDDGGNPLNETVSITFKLYNDSLSVSPGDKKWEETQTGVQVVNGLFNVMLGRVTALELDFWEDYWLDITVGAEHLPDRIRIASVGYAYRASVADSARAATPGSGSNWGLNGSVLQTNEYWGIARGGAGNILYSDSARTQVNLGVACTTGSEGDLPLAYYCATVGGGHGNKALYQGSTVSGGFRNTAEGGLTGTATVSGGQDNVAYGQGSTVGGGWENYARGDRSTVCGGDQNKADGIFSFVGGGRYDSTDGDYATVPGGRSNLASGWCSFAAGFRAKALHAGTFVWADDTWEDFASTGDDQFLIRASGGVGIGTNDPRRLLHLLGYNARILVEASSSNPEINFETSGDSESEVWAVYKHAASDDFRFLQNSTDRLTIQNATGNVGVGATDPGQKLDVNGIVRIRSWGLTPTHDVQVNADGDLCKVSSSKRYKRNIKELESDLDKILNLEPVSFEWKTTSEKSIGLIAEEVDQLIPELVGYDKEGRPDAVRYELLSLYVLELAKQQQKAMKELKEENEELRLRIEVLEAE